MMSATNTGNILIIDDEQEFVDILHDILKADGFAIRGTIDPQEGLRLIEKNEYDLVITDLKMPTIDGIEIVKSVKKHSPHSEVVVVTGHASIESTMLALKHDVYDYIVKPIDAVTLKNTVNNAMEKIRLRHENEALSHKLEKTLNDLSALYEISRFINSSYDLDEVLSFTADTLSASIGLCNFAIFLWDQNENRFSIHKGHGLHDDSLSGFTVRRNEGVFGEAFEKDDLVFVKSFGDDPAFSDGITGEDKNLSDSAAVLPFRADDASFGAAVFFNVDAERSEDMDMVRLASITMTQVVPIIRFYLHKAKQTLLWADPLFQIKEEMKSILEKARLYKGGLTFLMFKLYLRHGGAQANNILDIHQVLLDKLNSAVSTIDSIIVFGLDSFVVILQGRTKVSSEVFAGTIKKEVESNIFQKEDFDFVLDYGYARYPMDGTTAEDLIGRAQFNLLTAVKGK